ncbi:MAG TPA: ABC transporter substrate-binding protein [Flexivirga sp.]|uniref:ABC transporter substrate-binding protein n=1 Tax=Flexivirga sp. TaxID=1962927 RepID=UPI002CCF00F2|nr:ABC transporter substrate-binding protein [Flexivirga sp.]HWC22425.1 ABC transporter substrate-binding protein [Flexivirga sp.]
MRRTRVLATVTASVLVAGTASACGSSSGDGSGGSGGDITLGLLAPITGTFAADGKDMKDGANAAVKVINAAGGVNGKKLKLDIKDDGSDPQKTSQATRDLASAGHKLMFGTFTSTECLAVKSLTQSTGGVFIAPTCVDPTLTGGPGKKGTDGVFRTGLRSSPDQPVDQKVPTIMHELAPAVRTWDYFGYDYSFGHQQATTFKKNLQSVPGKPKMGSTVFVPMSSQDFRPYVSKLSSAVNKDSSGRGLFLGTYGAGTGSFMQQANSFNFLSKYKMVWTAGDAWGTLKALNGKFSTLWNSYDYIWAAYDNPTNKKFVANFKKAHKHMPGATAASAYNSVLAYAAAIKKAKSTDPSKVSAALAGLTFQSVQGEMTLDATTHQADTKQVISQLKGDASAPDKIKVLRTVIVDPKDASYTDGATGFDVK